MSGQWVFATQVKFCNISTKCLFSSKHQAWERTWKLFNFFYKHYVVIVVPSNINSPFTHENMSWLEVNNDCHSKWRLLLCSIWAIINHVYFCVQLLTSQRVSLLNESHKSLGASESHGPHHSPQLTWLDTVYTTVEPMTVVVWMLVHQQLTLP